MKLKALLFVGLLWLTPAFASSDYSYVCTQESEDEAVLGESFALENGEEVTQLAGEEFGVCEADEGELYGDNCELAGDVEVELDQDLQDGSDSGYLVASTDEEETIYACEAAH